MDIFENLSKHSNPQLAAKMSAYMRGLFPFLGIQNPTRTLLSKEFLQEKKKTKAVDWEFVDKCFALPQREFHYLALDHLSNVKKYLTITDLSKLKKLILTKSWWDSVDTISPLVGEIILASKEFREMEGWMTDENMWVRRVSIIFQLKYKANTNIDMLTKAIVSNKDTKEFFLNKAIGWALREYAKTDPKFVRRFLDTTTLSPLSEREASKHL